MALLLVLQGSHLENLDAMLINQISGPLGRRPDLYCVLISVM